MVIFKPAISRHMVELTDHIEAESRHGMTGKGLRSIGVKITGLTELAMGD